MMLMLFLSVIDTEEDRTKFELIYEKYRKLMFYIANQILHDDSLAEDAVHDAFIKIIENLDKIHDVNCHTTKSYIIIIVRNHSINLYNSRKKKSCIPIEEVEYMLFEELIIDDMDDNGFEKSSELSKAIMQLPVIYRDVIILKYVHELSNQEIGLSLNINEAAVRKRIERAKQKVKILLERED